jgi:hypothetical protein
MDGRHLIAVLLLLALQSRFVVAQGEKPVNTRIDPEQARIWVDAHFNGTAARLVLDTGAQRSLLYRGPAQQLGLTLLPFRGAEESTEAADGRVTFRSRTEKCTVTLGAWTFSDVSWPVLVVPKPVERYAAGVLGWDFIRLGVLEIDWGRRRVGFRKDVPSDCTGWARWRTRENAPALMGELASPGGQSLSLLVDTGAPGGVGFGEKSWRDWTRRHESGTTTLRGIYSPGHGFAAQPMLWAAKLGLGNVEIEGMPVGLDQHPILKTWRCDWSIGLLGLSRFNLVIDGPGQTVYLKPRAKFAWKVAYNRLGAVFIPNDLRSLELVAHVVSGSPAARAGIQNGDQLFKIGDLDVTAWRTDPKVLPLSRFWERPAGTELVLTLARGAEKLTITVKLEELFPDASRYNPQR